MLPQLVKSKIGPEFKNMFSSESPGATVFSSFESMAPTLAKEHWGVHGGQPADTCEGTHVCNGGNVMAQRNYANDNFVLVFFGRAALNQLGETGEAAFKKQVYWSMIAQALVIKQNIELTRSTNRFGTLVWQLNEIW